MEKNFNSFKLVVRAIYFQALVGLMTPVKKQKAANINVKDLPV